MKTCTKCGEDFTERDYRKDSSRRDGWHPWCRSCQYVAAREWNRNNRLKRKAWLADWASRNPDKVKAQQHRNNHARRLRERGMTVADYEALLETQGGVCAICHRPQSDGRARRLAIDHDHETGAVRGLLCSLCNKGLGNFQDSTDLLDAAYVYLGKHKYQIKVVSGGCATCGCLIPDEKHGDDRNVTVSELQSSAHDTRVAPKSMSVAQRNVKRTLRVARRRK